MSSRARPIHYIPSSRDRAEASSSASSSILEIKKETDYVEASTSTSKKKSSSSSQVTNKLGPFSLAREEGSQAPLIPL